MNNYKSTDKYTHLSYGAFTGKFNIPFDKSKEFIKLYIKAIANGIDNLNILEIQPQYAPIIIDIDLKSENDIERLYDDILIMDVIEKYKLVMEEYLKIDTNKINILVFEKNKKSDLGDIYKDGFHILFPDIVAHCSMRHKIRHEVVQLCKEEKMFNEFIENVDKIIDKAVVSSNGWFLYGSKKPNGELYKLTKIYNWDLENIFNGDLTDKKIIKYLSFHLNHEKYKKENANIEEINDVIEPINNVYNNINEENITMSKTDEIIKLLSCLNHERYSYEYWLNIGIIIFNEINDINIWKMWSKNYNKYDEEEINKKWKTFKKPNNNVLTIATLHKYAKEDNLEEYNKIIKEKNKIKYKKNIEKDLTEYYKIKDEFEKTHFKIMYPFMYATIRKDNSKLILHSRNEFINIYENLCYNDGEKQVPFVLSWFKDPNIRTYDKIDFLPQQIAPNNIYNSFNGYRGKYLPLIKTDIDNSLIMKHIREIICNNNNDIFNYFINYLANLIQHPYNKANTSIIIKSLQGAGKDTIFKWFGNNILGKEYYLNEDSLELIFGKFNSCIENKILIVLNEVSGKETFIINEKIKNAITREVNIIEHKGMKPYENTNNIGYIYLTNNDNPIKIPFDDRRFCGIESNNSMVNNFEYFNLLNDEIKNGEYDRAFYDYFMNINIENYNFTLNRPLTTFYENMREINIPVIAIFLQNIIDNNYDKETFIIQSSKLFFLFNEFLKDNNFKIDYTSTKFGLDIKKYDGIEKRKAPYGFDIYINIFTLKNFLINKYKIEFL
jgi:putative DNA primase/helicase